MKDIEKKDAPNVGGGYTPPPDGPGGCTGPFPWPVIEGPTTPIEPLDPTVDPSILNRV